MKTACAIPIVTGTAPRLFAAGSQVFHLTAHKQVVRLVGDSYPDTEIWGYNGQVPGPVVRATRGTRLYLEVRNELEQPTTVHWHGLRIENQMDGVPGLTQAPIEPGESFAYRFTPPDAGTFWYHSHVNSSEQVGRGLYGILIVDELDPPYVDRDVTWVLDDWLLDRQAQIIDSFDHPRDASHGGQIGNTVTINGQRLKEFNVLKNERLRLRIVNAANGRIFRLKFSGHSPVVIAMDGQPVTPHEPKDGAIVLGPAMRVDVILDCTAGKGQRFSIVDDAYRESYELVALKYQQTEPVREKPMAEVSRLASNGLQEPELTDAKHIDVAFGGGVHGSLDGATYNGQWLDIRSLFQQGKMWAINGIVGNAEDRVPLHTLKLGRTYLLHLTNNSVWPHPIHLHGHHFRLLSRNGSSEPYQPWMDTVLLSANDTADVALVADNPGDWMFHCHIPEHMATGMTTVFRVA